MPGLSNSWTSTQLLDLEAWHMVMLESDAHVSKRLLASSGNMRFFTISRIWITSSGFTCEDSALLTMTPAIIRFQEAIVSFFCLVLCKLR